MYRPPSLLQLCIGMRVFRHSNGLSFVERVLPPLNVLPSPIGRWVFASATNGVPAAANTTAHSLSSSSHPLDLSRREDFAALDSFYDPDDVKEA